MKKFSNLEIDWTVVDSPKNSFLKKKKFKEFVKRFNLKIELADYNQVETFFQKDTYDLTVFTEIAEHLDHS
ncbi:hypothetical protein KJ978_01325, partial [Patescibacteria group bacterium]|nr:hypothetical protein [Patescibacteria group bacterium]